MRVWTILLGAFVAVSAAQAAETLFTSGPQEYEGQKYYWLAQWKLEVTLPEDVAAGDRFEVLFGTKGPAKRTLAFEYDGRLQFDVPRHRLTFGFAEDWPRMNSVPEWFTVEPDESHHYEIRDADTGAAQVVSGRSLHGGWPVRLQPGKPLRLKVSLVKLNDPS